MGDIGKPRPAVLRAQPTHPTTSSHPPHHATVHRDTARVLHWETGQCVAIRVQSDTLQERRQLYTSVCVSDTCPPAAVLLGRHLLASLEAVSGHLLLYVVRVSEFTDEDRGVCVCNSGRVGYSGVNHRSHHLSL